MLLGIGQGEKLLAGRIRRHPLPARSGVLALPSRRNENCGKAFRELAFTRHNLYKILLSMMPRSRTLACLFGVAAAWIALEVGRLEAASRVDLWVTGAEPILEKHCFKCHGGVKQRGGLDLRSLETILRGGEHGPAIVPGNPAQSLLFQVVQPGAETQMPPEGRPSLNSGEREHLRSWIAGLPVRNQGGTNTADRAARYVSWLNSTVQPLWRPGKGLAPHEVIDGFVRRGWKQAGVRPTRLADDAQFVRRLYLDLAGRIPTPSESDAFLAKASRQKRAELVEALLNGDDYPRRMREVFDVVLMSRTDAAGVSARSNARWHAFLEASFRSNRPWNDTVKAMVLARPAVESDRGSQWFLYERKDNHQAMAEALGPIAFGMRIDCAQCHNHALSWEIEQRHYWGLVAAFKRGKNVETDSGPGVAESAIGGFMSFANLKKESQPAELVFPHGRQIPETRPGDNEKETDSPELYLIPPPEAKQKPAQPSVPKFSRRAALAEILCQDNPLLARAFVNRVWALMMGRGLVHPIDAMDSRHPASHPDLLDWLSADFERHGFDVKRLVREIALSRPYQLDSRLAGQKSPPAPERFARALEKPLTAEQLFASIRVVTGRWNAPLNDEERALEQTLAERFPEVQATDYNFALQQAMFLSNSPLLDKMLRSAAGPESSQVPNLGSLFQRVLGRPPSEPERLEAGKHLASRTAGSGLRDVLWALVVNPEFLLNH